jgi:uncharacterized protein YbjT (DUF2867 family)
MTVFAASATGKVGREVVKQLQKAGVPFKAGASDLERAGKTLGADVPLALVNYDQPETFAPPLEGVDRLFFLHPVTKPGMLPSLMAFVDKAVASGVKRVVFMAALGADLHPNDPINLLGQHIAKIGVEYTVLYPNWFMQNFNTDNLRQINEKNEIRLPSGNQPLSLIDVRDIAKVAVKLLTSDSPMKPAYTLTGSEALTYSAVAAKLSAAAGREIKHISPTVEEELDVLKKHNVPQEMYDFMEWLFRDIERGYTSQITTDVFEVTGEQPIPFDQYVRDYADVWKTRPEQA